MEEQELSELFSVNIVLDRGAGYVTDGKWRAKKNYLKKILVFRPIQNSSYDEQRRKLFRICY